MRYGLVLAAALLPSVRAQEAPSLPPGAVARLVPEHSPRGHVHRSFVFSPDGETLAAGGADGRVHFWGVRSGREFPPLEAHEGGVASIAYTPDGGTIVTVGGDRTIRQWDAVTRRPLQSIADGAAPMACSPDGRRLAAVDSAGRIRVLDSFTGTEVLRIAAPDGSVCSLGFSPDGKTLASGNIRGMVYLWDAVAGGSVSRFQACLNGRPVTLSWSPDGRTLATGTYGPDAFRLWEASSGKELFNFREHNS
jgi:WD40 repeat protein